MRRERFTSRRWPSAQQTLILRAAISPGSESIDAWLASGETGNLQVFQGRVQLVL